jgi:hypothetical protein
MTHAWDDKKNKTFWSENLKGRNDAEDLGVDGKIILDWILGKYGERVSTGCIWLRTGTSGGLLENSSELSGGIKGREFFD